MSNIYLERYALPETLIPAPPADNTGLIIVIPSYKEAHLRDTLISLSACERPACNTEIIVVINEPAGCNSEIQTVNEASFRQARECALDHNTESLRFHILYVKNIDKKHHGVGLARKIGMDEAVRRFEYQGNHQVGIIAGFDADSTCRSNYLVEIERHFKNNPECPGISVYFEHPVSNEIEDNIREGIIQYELHLRYFSNARKYAGFQHVHQTIGSCMAVRSDAYMKQGGMNKRKAGEDFYFLNKIIAFGNFMDLKTTTVYPSPRISDRVPFGTGKALSDWIKHKSESLLTYNPASFSDLKCLTGITNKLYEGDTDELLNKLPDSVGHFLRNNSFKNKLAEITANTASCTTFLKRFYQYFDAFRVMKYLHFSRSQYHPDLPVTEAAEWLLKERYGIEREFSGNSFSLLCEYREIDKYPDHT
ncbi:MAG: hypothetical protein IH947_02320 [Bacteroidetes bacterium]|nr:hypothetical protein [Bacteroidota bacterium]